MVVVFLFRYLFWFGLLHKNTRVYIAPLGVLCLLARARTRCSESVSASVWHGVDESLGMTTGSVQVGGAKTYPRKKVCGWNFKPVPAAVGEIWQPDQHGFSRVFGACQVFLLLVATR
jgi:hypothetical protein